MGSELRDGGVETGMPRFLLDVVFEFLFCCYLYPSVVHMNLVFDMIATNFTYRTNTFDEWSISADAELSYKYMGVG